MGNIRQTGNSKILGIIRILLGFQFLMAGFMKLLVPMLQEAFAGQLSAAKIPMIDFNMWFVPIVEVVLGAFLLVGIYARLAALVIFPLMAVATYVHLVVNDPNLFPLQPEKPIIPLINMVLAFLIVSSGAGAWSADRSISK